MHPRVSCRSSVIRATLMGTSLLVFAISGSVQAAAPADVQFPVLSSGLRALAKPVGPVPLKDTLTLQLTLRSAHEAGLVTYAGTVENPVSPNYHHFLSPKALLQRFGPGSSAGDVSAWLHQQGFWNISRQGFEVTATGSAAVINRAFDITLTRFRVGIQVFTASLESASLPAGIGRDISGIDGLNTYRMLPSTANSLRTIPMHPASSLRPAAATSSSNGLSVAATLLSGPRATGLPASWLLTATLNGTPDPQATIVQGTTSASLGVSQGYGATAAGQMLFRTTALDAGSPSLTISVASQVDALGSPVGPQVEVSLPSETWTGPPADGQALSASEVNAVYHAGALAKTYGPQARIALFAASAPSTADLKGFVNRNHLPMPTVNIIPVDGGNPQVSSANGTELMLDLEALATAAPGATIDVYTVPAANPSFTAALNAAVVSGQNRVFSISFGEVDTNTGGLTTLLPAAAAEGMTVVDSSGDGMAYSALYGSGSLAAAISTAVTSYPATLSGITAVGGTELSVDASSGAMLTDAAWGGNWPSRVPAAALAIWLSNQTAAGSGGGFSGYQAIPSWQRAFLPPGSPGRGVPDLAFLASPNYPGFAAWLGGQESRAGGTSLAAPLFAGWLADIDAALGHGLGNINPLLYQLAALDPWLFHQAAYGSNGAYSISNGQSGSWNAVTGLGSLDIGALFATLTGAPAVSRGLFGIAPGQSLGASTVALAQSEYPVGPAGHRAVLSSGAPNHLVDALTSAPLAYRLGGPLLLSNANGPLGRSLLQYLSQAHIQTVYLMGILGGGQEAATEAAIRAVLPNMQFVSISGADRYQTADLVATRLGSAGTVFVASGQNAHIVDAIAGAAAAARIGAPMLLVDATTPVPQSLLTGVQKSVILGWAATYHNLGNLPGPQVLQGADRNQTAAAIAEAWFPQATAAFVAPGDPSGLGVTLALGPYAARLNAPILLDDKGQYTATVNYLHGHSGIAGIVLIDSASQDAGFRAALLGR